MAQQHAVELTYFKDTGKLYASGNYTTSREQLYEVWDDVRRMKAEGTLPGLLSGSRQFHILVSVPTMKHNHFRLIPLDG